LFDACRAHVASITTGAVMTAGGMLSFAFSDRKI